MRLFLDLAAKPLLTIGKVATCSKSNSGIYPLVSYSISQPRTRVHAHEERLCGVGTLECRIGALATRFSQSLTTSSLISRAHPSLPIGLSHIPRAMPLIPTYYGPEIRSSLSTIAAHSSSRKSASLHNACPHSDFNRNTKENHH